ncbi:MAG: hypothetical protein MUC83_13885 [Pirellula sp.]|jgi:hypothetical protein|nr:hypothetical protein [Pirellula sp.]
MEYTFILSRDIRIDTIIRQLELIDGVEVESIDDELVMLRMRGPKDVAADLDVTTRMLMKKCSVGVPEKCTN